MAGVAAEAGVGASAVREAVVGGVEGQEELRPTSLRHGGVVGEGLEVVAPGMNAQAGRSRGAETLGRRRRAEAGHRRRMKGGHREKREPPPLTNSRRMRSDGRPCTTSSISNSVRRWRNGLTR